MNEYEITVKIRGNANSAKDAESGLKNRLTDMAHFPEKAITVVSIRKV